MRSGDDDAKEGVDSEEIDNAVYTEGLLKTVVVGLTNAVS